jgi:HEAT repeat protein
MAAERSPREGISREEGKGPEDIREKQADEYEGKYAEKLSFFIDMLRSENVGWRWKAAEALARLGDLQAVDPLIRALDDEDWRVRQKAAWALGYLGDPRAIIPLRRAYRDEREGVKEIIMEALTMINEQMARQ